MAMGEQRPPRPVEARQPSGAERVRIMQSIEECKKQTSDGSLQDSPRLKSRVRATQSLPKLAKAGENPFVEYEDREQRLSLERRWLQEDRSYLDTRVKELRHKTAQRRKDAMMMHKVAGPTGEPQAEIRRTSGTTSLPELPRGLQTISPNTSPWVGRSGRKQSAAVRSLKDLQRELKESLSSIDKDKRPTSKVSVDKDKHLVLPLLGLQLHQRE